jgi:phenylacetate-CoA ligase
MQIQKIIEKLMLPAGDVLNRSSFVASLKKARTIAFLDNEGIELVSKQKLHHLLSHATQHAPWYRQFGTGNFSLEDAALWLGTFPQLDKATLRAKASEMLTMPKDKLIKCASSGSSGFQSITWMDKGQQSVTRAVQTLWWEWAGYKLGDPILQTGINPKRTFEKRLKDRVLNTFYMHAFSHTREEVIKGLLWAQKQKDPVLGGYASSLYVIATIAKEAGVQVNFKTAISWGDKLFDHYRKAVLDVFGCKTFESYGSAEGFMMAAQYDLDYLYQMLPYVYLEILDDAGNPVPDGQMGHVVVTNLDSYAMPMIRYRIGDLAIKLPKAAYPVHRTLQLPLLQKVVGRDTDLVKTRSGKYMVVHSFTGIFEHLPQISQFCVVQQHLDAIDILYIPGEGFNRGILDHVQKKIHEFLGEPLSIRFEQVQEMAPTKSGKPQLIVSSLKH